MAVARLLGSQMQEMNRVSMHTLKAVQEELSAHTETLISREAESRVAADDALAARVAALEQAGAAPDARPATAERPPPPTSAPPAFRRRGLGSKHSHPFVRQSTTGGKTRFHLYFRNRHIRLFDCTAQGAKCYENLQDCLQARDRMILDAGCVLFEGEVCGRLGTAL